MPTLGIDIGGANLKFANAQGKAISTTFPMWKRSAELANALHDVSAGMDGFDRIAVTMTGEMADCFANRSLGVRFIVDSVTNAFQSLPVAFYSVDGNWLTDDRAASDPISLAASNWRALAQYVANQIDAHSVLIDIGSTTSDLISLSPRQVLTQSRTDLDRLLNHELVYTGLERSNIAGLLHSITFQNKTYPIVNEQFATSLDAHLILGNLPESQSCDDTADGSPRTLASARQRLARSIGADADWISNSLIQYIARCALEKQQRLIGDAIQSRLRQHPASQAIISGHGGTLAQSVLESIQWSGKTIDLSQWIGPEASRAACAYAVAVLYDKILVA